MAWDLAIDVATKSTGQFDMESLSLINGTRNSLITPKGDLAVCSIEVKEIFSSWKAKKEGEKNHPNNIEGIHSIFKKEQCVKLRLHRIMKKLKTFCSWKLAQRFKATLQQKLNTSQSFSAEPYEVIHQQLLFGRIRERCQMHQEDWGGDPSPESQSMTHLWGGHRACGKEQLQSRKKHMQEVTMKGRGKSSELLWCVIELTQKGDTSKDWKWK